MKRTLLIILVLVLVGAAINVPVALHWGTSAPRTARLPARANLFGAEAADAGWPARPPLEWPTVTQWSEDGTLFHVRRTAWRAAEGKTTHQMQVDSYGWPLTVIQRRLMWWPWQDPRWASDVRPDSGLALHWSGLVLNPLLFGVVAWLLLVAPVAGWRSARRGHRRRRGQCPMCGYPRGASGTCSECGTLLPAAAL